MSTAGFWLCDRLLVSWVTAQTGPYHIGRIFPRFRQYILAPNSAIQPLAVGQRRHLLLDERRKPLFHNQDVRLVLQKGFNLLRHQRMDDV